MWSLSDPGTTANRGRDLLTDTGRSGGRSDRSEGSKRRREAVDPCRKSSVSSNFPLVSLCRVGKYIVLEVCTVDRESVSCSPGVEVQGSAAEGRGPASNHVTSSERERSRGHGVAVVRRQALCWAETRV